MRTRSLILAATTASELSVVAPHNERSRELVKAAFPTKSSSARLLLRTPLVPITAWGAAWQDTAPTNTATDNMASAKARIRILLIFII